MPTKFVDHVVHEAVCEIGEGNSIFARTCKECKFLRTVKMHFGTLLQSSLRLANARNMARLVAVEDGGDTLLRFPLFACRPTAVTAMLE